MNSIKLLIALLAISCVLPAVAQNSVVRSSEYLGKDPVKPSVEVAEVVRAEEAISRGDVVHEKSINDSEKPGVEKSPNEFKTVGKRGGHEIIVSANPLLAHENNVMNWCDYRDKGERFFSGNEHYGFVVHKGSLSDNVKAVIDSFYPGNQGLIDKVGRHEVIAEACVVEKSVDLIVQKIIEPYLVDKSPVAFASFTNNVYALFYKNDKEFDRYMRGVRKW